jgi:hypothetical protein
VHTSSFILVWSIKKDPLRKMQTFTSEDGCKNHCQTHGCDEGHIPQDPAISLLRIAFVRTREKGVRVTSDQRIIALLDNLFVFFRFVGISCYLPCFSFGTF